MYSTDVTNFNGFLLFMHDLPVVLAGSQIIAGLSLATDIWTNPTLHWQLK
jgi:hypothetical protein